MLSHKQRPEDKERGLAAGADEYLTKGGFQEDALVSAVHRLIGAARK
jgi:two-component system sensor histidine kinase and response regulator WspE